MNTFEEISQKEMEDWTISDIESLENQVIQDIIWERTNPEHKIDAAKVASLLSKIYGKFFLTYHEQCEGKFRYELAQSYPDIMIENKNKTIVFHKYLVDGYYVSKNTTSISHLKFPPVILYSEVEKYFPEKAGFKEFPLHTDIRFEYR